ncbi:MAG: terminase large subunit [Lentisphaeria bacterium]|nr:terminase large subunit [Lentisphaeria bacterium]
MKTTSTASENYIWTYYQKICDGSETVGEWIRKWYEIIVHGLQEKRWTFDQKKANEAINFVERYCHHHEGPLAPGLIKLELWQKAFLSVVYGIMDENGRRQFREIVLLIGRKQGKTIVLGGLGCHHLFKDGGYGSRVMVCAPKLEQSKLCYEAIYQTIRKEPMMDRMTKRRRTDLYIEKNNSSAQPLAFSAKRSDGLNISMGILDEFGAWEGQAGLRQAEVVKSSQGARPEPLLFYISTANFVDGGLYDEILKRATAVLNGTSKETRLAPFLYMIDDVDKWNDINELKKSLPNLGVSVSVDYMLEEIAVAEGSLSKKSEFLTKYCNIKQNSSMAWLTAQDIRKCFGNDLTYEDFRHSYALGGIDLSLAVDLTAAVVVIEKDGVSWFFTQFFMPENKVQEATARDGLPYDIYRQRGLLTVCGENTVDYHAVHEWFRMLEKQYEILPLKVGYDRYSAAYLVQDMETDGYTMESVSQGSNLTGVLIDMEGMIKDGRLRCANDNDLMKIHMLDSALKYEDGTNRRRLIKINSRSHIDGMAALSDAICMRHNYYEELAGQLSNKR